MRTKMYDSFEILFPEQIWDFLKKNLLNSCKYMLNNAVLGEFLFKITGLRLQHQGKFLRKNL